MTAPEINPAPVLDLAPKDKWEQERIAFYRLLPNLLQSHLGKFVAIHAGQVVESGDDLIQVAKQAYARFGYIPIYVGLVSVEPRTARRPSPRLVRDS